MATPANAVRLMEMGFTEPLAVELKKQMDTQTGNMNRLIELGVLPGLAKELAAQIQAGGTISAVKLAERNMVPDQAVELATQITASR